MMPLTRSLTDGKAPVTPQDPVRRRWRSFKALSPSDRILFVKLWGMLTIVSLLIRLLNYQRTHRLLSRFLPKATEPRAEPQHATSHALRIGELARIAGRSLPTNASCLRQSLLVWWLLRRRGLAAELRIGVSRSAGFTAHAWVELEGRPINDRIDVADRFAAFDRIHR